MTCIFISTFRSLTLYVPCIVTNYINKPIRCTLCMYLFYNFCTGLHVSNDYFVHHQEFVIYCICNSVQTMQTCHHMLVPTVRPSSWARLRGLYRAADTVNLRTPDGERNTRSKHVELQKYCRINTYKKYILLVCL